MMNLICPNCHTDTAIQPDLKQTHCSITCAACNTLFDSWTYRIRSKNSRHVTAAGARTFDIRVIDALGGEDFIQFATAGHNFEMRARDIVSFGYVGQQLCLIQNFTINHWLDLRQPPASRNPCGATLGCIIAFIVLVSVLFALWFVSQ